MPDTEPNTEMAYIDGPDEIQMTFRGQIQNGYDGQTPDPSRFLKVPRCDVERLGGVVNHMGNLNPRPLLYSSILYAVDEQSGQSQTRFDSCEEVVSIPENEAVYTKERGTRDALALIGWDRSEMYKGENEKTDRFNQWYEKFLYHYGKIEEIGAAEARGEVVEGSCGVLGTRWAVAPSMDTLNRLPACSKSHVLPEEGDVDDDELLDYYTDSGGLVDVRGLYTTLLRRRNPELYTLSETCFSVEQRHAYGDVVEWVNRHSTSECGADSEMDDQARHQRVGAWREEDTEADGKGCDPGPVRFNPVLVPWIVLECNDGDLVDRIGHTKDLLERLDTLGADLSTVSVTFSGNKSFHVRIPIGQVHAQVFGSADDAQSVIAEWADQYIEQSLDRELFDPFHLVRTPGSRHEESGRYVTTYNADVFMEIGLGKVVQDSEEHQPHRFKHPFTVQPSGLADTFQHAKKRAAKEWIPGPDEITIRDNDEPQSGGVIDEIRQGVGKGEHFGTGHQGRNKACFIWACYCLERYSTAEARRKTEAWAQRCRPPLGDHPEDQRREWEKCFESAQRTV